MVDRQYAQNTPKTPIKRTHHAFRSFRHFKLLASAASVFPPFNAIRGVASGAFIAGDTYLYHLINSAPLWITSSPRLNSRTPWLEDALALLFGTLMISFGVVLFRQSGALTGGTAGLAFLIHYTTHISFGVAFFVINLPFYWLSVRRMGAQFTLKTFCAVAMVSLFSDLHGRFIHIDQLNPFYATLFANIMMGVGFVVLFRHKASPRAV